MHERREPSVSDIAEIRRLTLKKTRLGLQARIDSTLLREMSLEQASGFIADMWVAQLRLQMLGNTISRVVTDRRPFPETWWDAFKQAFFPRWLEKRFPVRTEWVETVVEFTHVCPHIGLPQSHAEQNVHLEFLTPPEALWRQQ